MVSLRELSAEDAVAFQAVRLQALRDAPTAFAASFEEEASRSNEEIASRLVSKTEIDRFVIGAFHQHELVGIGGFFREGPLKLRHIGWVWGLFVVPAFRGSGLGRKLLSRIIESTRPLPGLLQLQIRVGTHNSEAQRLYESMGFKKVAVLPNALRVESRSYDEALLVYATHAV